MTVKTCYDTIAHWLNSCITDEQIDLCVEVAKDFLMERHGAEEKYLVIKQAAELKKELPTYKLETA